MEWKGTKSDRFVLVRLTLRDGDSEYGSHVIFSRDFWKKASHLEVLEEEFGGVGECLRHGRSCSNVNCMYWLTDRDGAAQIDGVEYMTEGDYNSVKKFGLAYLLAAEEDYDCMVCGVVSESDMTQDDQLCDPCLKTHGQCGVCQDFELLTDLHLDSTGMMELCARCEKHDETFESTPYSNYYGACLTPDGGCFETTMENCRTLNGRFQGPGTSCGGYQPPLMAAEESKPQGKGLWIAITVGVMTGVASAVFGNVISEMWLDRLREDPELNTTPEEGDPV